MAGYATSYQPWLLLCVDVYPGVYVAIYNKHTGSYNLGMMQYMHVLHVFIYLLAGS